MDFTVIPKPQQLKLSNGKCSKLEKIVFSIDSTLPNEGYHLTVTADGATVLSSTETGAFYAKKTLDMMFQTLGYYPHCDIIDYPKCAYRSVMLDVGRYFYPVDDIKKLIDDASKLKLNVFHWHLTEDQGWRPQIDAYPTLTEIGSKRNSTNGFPCPSKGFYSKAEMRDVVKYAHDRHMIVVPEVDIPGHTRGAIAGLKELSCFNRELPVANHFGVKHDILCAGRENTYNFLKTVFAELCEIFTDGYFHLGADEAVKMRWKLCPDCQQVIKQQNLKDEDALQIYFLNRLNREFFKPRNIRPIIWVCEAAPENLDLEFVLMHYGGGHSAEIGNSLKLGYDVISADSNFFYFDFPHKLTPLSKTFEGGKLFAKQGVDSAKSTQSTAVSATYGHLLGGSLSIWTEYIPRMSTLEKRVFPRILAGAEAMWSPYDKDNYPDFEKRAHAYEDTYKADRNFTSVEYANRTKGFMPLLDKLWWARRPL
ncbi:MAG: family 20 glycosylhydrolase, partial [Clostridia bacterium]